MTWLFAGLALLSSALNTIFNRLSSNKVGSIASAVLKGIFIVAGCAIFATITGNIKLMFTFTSEQYIWIAVLGAVTAIDWIFYFLSIKRAHLEAFSPFDASGILFFSNLLFSIFMFDSVTNGRRPLNIVFFFAGLAFLLAGMLYSVFNKKINPTAKKAWVLYGILTTLSMAFTLVIVKTKLNGLPTEVITLYQMAFVLIISLIMLIFSKQYKEFKTLNLKEILLFVIASIFNMFLMVFRYNALSYPDAIPSIVNVIVSLDFVLVSIATVLFFKAKNKKELCVLLSFVVCGMILNVIAGLI